MEKAVGALRNQLDEGGRTLDAQDFRHSLQKEGETVSDYIRRLESTFKIAYGRDAMAAGTRDTLLHGQFQEGLQYELMRSPAVSGASTYKELCLAAKNEEKRLLELKKRQLYRKTPISGRRELATGRSTINRPQEEISPNESSGNQRCFQCGKIGHLAKECRMRKSESRGTTSGGSTTWKIATTTEAGLTSYLYQSDSSEDEAIRKIQVQDQGSHSHIAKVLVQGYPADGIVDSCADITIINGHLLKQVAAAAKLRKRDLKKADKTPLTYNRQTFSLDGRFDLNIAYGEKVLRTPVYVKLDPHDPLLLSEGVCRQLGIITYHPDVVILEKDKKKSGEAKEAVVPMVRVQLLQSVRILPQQSMTVRVKPSDIVPATENAWLLEPEVSCKEMGIHPEETLIAPTTEARLVITNSSGFTQRLEEGVVVGTMEAVTVVDPRITLKSLACVGRITEGQPRTVEWRKNQISQTYKGTFLLPEAEELKLMAFLMDHHEVFALEEGERGETSLMQLEIDTGNATPIKQQPRRLPFAVREVAQQLDAMTAAGVIQPSQSPWASPVVLVRK